MIHASGIYKGYGKVQVLNNVSLDIQKSEIVSIVGASGAGKTTLLQILGTLDNPDKGTVTIDGVNPFQLKQRELARFRNLHLGFVFQFHNLLAEFTANENVCIPALIAGIEKKEAEKKAAESAPQIIVIVSNSFDVFLNRRLLEPFFMRISIS